MPGTEQHDHPTPPGRAVPIVEYLCDKNAVTHNLIKGIKRPSVEGYQGKTRAIGDHQARSLLDFPKNVSLKGKHDRLFWRPCSITPWREELCKLLVKDFKHERRRVAQLKVSRKDGKTPYIPLHPAAGGLILEYLEKLGAWGGCEWDSSFGPSAITAPVHWQDHYRRYGL